PVRPAAPVARVAAGGRGAPPAALHGPASQQLFEAAMAKAHPGRQAGAGDALFERAVDPKAAAPAPAAGAPVAQAASAATPGGAADAAASAFPGGPGTHPGGNPSQAQIAAWMGGEGPKRALPAPVAGSAAR